MHVCVCELHASVCLCTVDEHAADCYVLQVIVHHPVSV